VNQIDGYRKGARIAPTSYSEQNEDSYRAKPPFRACDALSGAPQAREIPAQMLFGTLQFQDGGFPAGDLC